MRTHYTAARLRELIEQAKDPEAVAELAGIIEARFRLDGELLPRNAYELARYAQGIVVGFLEGMVRKLEGRDRPYDN